MANKRAENRSLVIVVTPFKEEITYKNSKPPSGLPNLDIPATSFTISHDKIIYHVGELPRYGSKERYITYNGMKFRMPDECVRQIEGLFNEDYPLLPGSSQFIDRYWKFDNVTYPVGTLIPYVPTVVKYRLYSKLMNEELISTVPDYNIYTALFMPVFLEYGSKLLKI